MLIGALGVGGLKAVQLLEGALTQYRCAHYIRHILAPQLRRGDALVLDNLPVHKLTGLCEELARRGVEILFLPPYLPDFTPVEQAQARTRQALELALQTAIDWISSTDAKAWFKYCGYYDTFMNPL